MNACTVPLRSFVYIVSSLRLVAFVLSLPPMAVVYTGFADYLGFYSALLARDCTHPDYNEHLRSLFGLWRRTVHGKHAVMLFVGVAGFLLDVLTTLLLIKAMPAKESLVVMQPCDAPFSARFLDSAAGPAKPVPDWVALAVVLENDWQTQDLQPAESQVEVNRVVGSQEQDSQPRGLPDLQLLGVEVKPKLSKNLQKAEGREQTKLAGLQEAQASSRLYGDEFRLSADDT